MKRVIQTCTYIILLYICIACSTRERRLETISSPNLFPTLSSEDVTDFVMDKNGYMWIGTSDGLNLFDGKNFRHYLYIPGDSSSLADNHVQFLFKDSQERIWIGTNNGISKYLGYDKFQTIPIPQKYAQVFQLLEDKNRNLFLVTDKGIISYNEKKHQYKTIFSYSSRNKNQIKFFIDKNNNFWEITLDSINCYEKDFKKIFSTPNLAALNLAYATMDGNNLWSAGGNGLLKLNIENRKTTVIKDSLSFHQADIVPRNIFIYNHKIWLAAKNSIYSYNPENKEFVCEEKMTDIIFNHFSSFISATYVDTKNDLWFGFSNGGFSNLKRLSNDVALHHHSLIENLKDTPIRSLSREKNILWGIQNNNDVFSYDMSSKKFQLFRGKSDIKGIITPRYQHQLNSICCTQGYIWLISNSRLMCYNYVNQKLDLQKTFRFGIEKILIGNFCTDHLGNLFVTTNAGKILRFSPDGEKVDTINLTLPSYDKESLILFLSSGQMLVCSKGMQFASNIPHTNFIQPLAITTCSHIEGITPICMLEDKLKNIWIGTNKGLYQFNLRTSKLTHVSAFPNIYVSSILENEQQNLWIGTHHGIAEYSPEKNEMTFYSTAINPQEKYRIFHKNSATVLDDSIYFFGHSKGCSVFTSSTMRQNTLPVIHLKKILINKTNGTKNIDCLCHPVQSLTLNYNENDLTIDFGEVCYTPSPQYSCLYKMDGFDPEWIQSNDNRQAIYSNLPAGNYTFRVKLVISGKSNSFSEQEIQITVNKAPWLSTSAIILYILFITGSILYVNRLYLHIKSDQLIMQMLQRDKEREHLTNQMNMSFFANISHEFRNPLTMILGPIITLQKEKNLSTQGHQLLQIILSSINQMLKLIDQMLDFNKLENDALKMQINKYDIADEINNLVKVFRASTIPKNIQVECYGLDTSLFVWLDKDKLDKILSNLFTNALKHTSQNGTIKIGLDCINYEQAISIIKDLPIKSSRYIHIYVQDSGNGIPEEQLNDIFKRYYQADNKSGLKYANWGTGIGLYYVKRLVQLHHGEVKAENVKDQQSTGALFHVIFPTDEEAYENDEKITVDNTKASTLYTPGIYTDTEVKIDPSKPYMLIVDDDMQASFYLKSLFSKEYNIINKYNAESAIASLETIAPDIILSDVVMNEMSGYELCRELKTSQLYCHIPIVLITAKTQIEEQVEGLNVGASAYVTKPFNPEYLKALIKSLLQNRDNIRALLLSSSTTSQKVTNALSSQDMIFMKNLYKLLDTMMSQDDLNFNIVAEKLCMSRSKFNYKLKGLTGETPIHFFLKYKLNKAAELLKSGKYNVSEVADLTGFGTVSHFSISFKKYFGVNPSEYK